MFRKTVLAIALPALFAATSALAGDRPSDARIGQEAQVPLAAAGGIRTFTPERNGDGLYLQDYRRNWYYATFAPRCQNLDFAFSVRFRTWAGSSTLSRGDTIYAGDEPCRIMSLVHSAPPPVKAKATKTG